MFRRKTNSVCYYYSISIFSYYSLPICIRKSIRIFSFFFFFPKRPKQIFGVGRNERRDSSWFKRDINNVINWLHCCCFAGNVRGHTEVCLMVARGWYHCLDGPYCLVVWPDRWAPIPKCPSTSRGTRQQKVNLPPF